MEEQQSYLSDIEFNPVHASTGQRLLNYVIDVISFIVIFYLAIVIYIAAGGTITESDPYSGPDILFRVFVTFLFAIYYFLSEMLFKGRTIGKLITGTRAVNEDGTEMD